MIKKLIFLLLLSMVFIVPISLACSSNEIPIKYNNENYCIKCNGAVTENNGQLTCVTCENGFQLQNGICVPAKYQGTSTMSSFDSWIQKTIPSANPYLPYFIIIIIVAFVVYILLNNKIKLRL